jgi:hypothetical protein
MPPADVAFVYLAMQIALLAGMFRGRKTGASPPR